VVGDGGARVLETLLGPAYGSLLPLLMSAGLLFLISWVDRRRESG
jgi:hypothetical protein